MNIIHRKDLAKGFAGVGLLLLSNAAFAQFSPLFTVGKGSGDFLVKRPSCEFEGGSASRSYPYGSEIIVQKGAKVFIFLSSNRQIHFGEGTRFLLGDDPDVEGGKRIVLYNGSIETLLGTDEDVVYPLSVVTDAAKFDNFIGRVAIHAESDASGYKTVVKTTAGKVTIEAPQLKPSRIGTGIGFAIGTKSDLSYTELKGLLGDFAVQLDQGAADPFAAEFHVGSIAKIWRKWAPLNRKLAVSVMLAEADGAVAKSYAFIEGQAPVLNGGQQEVAEATTEATEEKTEDGGDALGTDFSTDSTATDFGTDGGSNNTSFGGDLPAFDDFSF